MNGPRSRRDDRSFDAIVVGSGITGGWAAKELTERGLRVLVLEAGRDISPARDYVEHVPPWQMPYRGKGDRKALHLDQPIQSECYACDEYSSKFFVSDRDNPYSTTEGKPFKWIRGRQVGGRSITWGKQVYRWSDLDFGANARDGHGVDWPIRYKDIAPWYDYVERFIGICGHAEGLSQLPDGQFLPAMPLNCAEEKVRDAIAAKWGRARVLTNGRAAIITQDHGGRAACHYCGPCERGCITGSYFSSLSATLPAAAATGRMTLRPNSVVESVLYDATRGRARGVRVIDALTGESSEYEGRVVFLCASALESARLLLNSRSERWPDGLANGSGEVGHNLMDHCYGAGANGTIPGNEDRLPFGRRPNGIYVARFRNVTDRHSDFVRGYGFQGSAGREGWGRNVRGIGADLKRELIEERGPWRMWLGGWGECLPRHENFVALDPDLKDRWGVPALKIECTFGPNERAILADAQLTASEMLEAAGATDISTFDDKLAPGFCIHEMGTARMGRDPKTSVLNRWNQSHEIKNLFITDGACMASSANQNPSITYMALTARACDYAVRQLNRHAL
jgi:choline dehydrogenase-like flavoprotein